MQGNPVLREVLEECHYRFDWPTNVICAEHSIEIRPSNCTLFSNDTNIEFDLKSVTDKGNIEVSRMATQCDKCVCLIELSTIVDRA